MGFSLLRRHAQQAAAVRLLAQGAKASYRLGLLTGLGLCSWLTSQGQDIILQQDKTRTEATVVEITDDAVRYKRFDSPDGPIYSVKKTTVFMIMYKNGRTESFDATPPVPAQPSKPADIIRAATAPAEPARKPVAEHDPIPAGAGVLKKRHRIIFSPGSFISDNGLGYPALKAGIEVVDRDKKIGWLSGFNNVGVGVAASGLFGGGLADSNGNTLMMFDKYYLSGYAFKEFDLRSAAFGIQVGPSLNYTEAIYYNDSTLARSADISTGFVTVGLSFGEYFQKYIFGTNKKGERTAFMRFGFDQHFMAKGSSSSAFFISLGF